MSMFCYQCQETCKGSVCDVSGMCGKKPDTANLQDLLVFVLKGIATVAEAAGVADDPVIGCFTTEALFMTITNANFDNERFESMITEALELRNRIKTDYVAKMPTDLADCATWNGTVADYAAKAPSVGVLTAENEDVRSLRELLIYGLKGVAAYANHAALLGKEDDNIYSFTMEALASTVKDLTVDEMVGLVLKCGECAVTTMALLDAANTEAYGNPEMSTVQLGVGTKPGILVSGHDLKDIEELLKQTVGTGVDIYTHSEMLPTHYYPEFKKYDHLVGNYGGSWWEQGAEFTSFNGPILMTTNCITPVKDAYRERIYTTGAAGYPGVKHIADRLSGEVKDFSEIIAQAKTCAPPTEIETGEIIGGFAHNQVLALADKVVEGVTSGAIKRFIVMAGCDGRHSDRDYFTDVAKALPEGTIILTAGCAKYRYNKLQLGDIGGIPRVLDAGQCNDSYSLAVIALKLKEVFALEDINDLPISFDIGWYEQKAVAVLLALLFLGVKDIRLGPSLPAFISPNVLNVLVENFNLKPTGEVQADIDAMMQGE